MEFIIRSATASDIPDVARLQQAFITEHQQHYDPVFYALNQNAVQEWSTWASKKLESKELGFFIALKDNKIVGYITGYIEQRAPIYHIRMIGYISNLYITPDFRGKKIGTQLHKALIQWFKEKDVGHIELNVNSRATTTIETWHHLGYTEVGKRMRMTL